MKKDEIQNIKIKKSSPTLNEEDDIDQLQIKETLIKFSNQSHRHHSYIDTIAVEQ